MDFDTRVGCYAWIEREGQVLLAHWRQADPGGREMSGWTLPGGGMEIGETPEQTAVREVREESGLDVELGPLLGVRTIWIAPERRLSDPTRPMQSFQVVYRGVVTGGELTVEVGGSTDDVRWVPLGALPELGTVSLVDAAARWARGASVPGGGIPG